MKYICIHNWAYDFFIFPSSPPEVKRICANCAKVETAVAPLRFSEESIFDEPLHKRKKAGKYFGEVVREFV